MTDVDGNKITDEGVLDYIQKVSGGGMNFVTTILNLALVRKKPIQLADRLISLSVTWSRFVLCIFDEEIGGRNYGDGPHVHRANRKRQAGVTFGS